jgi:hypothetical protein
MTDDEVVRIVPERPEPEPTQPCWACSGAGRFDWDQPCGTCDKDRFGNPTGRVPVTRRPPPPAVPAPDPPDVAYPIFTTRGDP